MTRILKVVVKAGIGCCLMAGNPVYGLEELHRIDHLEPMPQDRREIGWKWHFVDQNGKTGVMEKVAGDRTTARYLRSDGCAWTRLIAGFAPASEWSNCPTAGKSNVTFVAGSIWPLQTGNTFSYEIKSAGAVLKNTSTFRCEVQGQWRIRTVSGEHDTFKVVCEQRWGKRIWWLSPAAGTAVAYKQTSIRGDLQLQEMTRIEH